MTMAQFVNVQSISLETSLKKMLF